MDINQFKSLYEGTASVTLHSTSTGSEIRILQVPGAVIVDATLRCMASHLPVSMDDRIVATVIHHETASWEDIARCPIVAAVLLTM